MSQNRSDYHLSVLNIEAEASVVLASRKIPLKNVLTLSQGSMLTFEKSHDEPLVLQIGNQKIALGDAVKIGDKFGLRIRQTSNELEAE